MNAAVADTPFGPFEDYRTILSTGDGEVANGPGHNGYFYIPKEDLYLNVYHRHKPGLTDGNARFVCIDIMQFDEEGRIIPTVMTHEWMYENGKVEILE